MISFYPGPSRIYPQVKTFLTEAFDSGILSMNHRSPEFVNLCKETVAILKTRLAIPEEYEVYFVSSATECWEIIAQSLIQKQSFHFYNGSFGEKWFNHTANLHPEIKCFDFSIQETLPVETVHIGGAVEMICITHNETSNGTAIDTATMQLLRKKYPDKLISVDATSSLAGIALNIQDADVWFASVQKCMGLPSGMAVMICSPQAIERALKIKEEQFYNSFLFLHERMKDWQTPHTPNILNIYLLKRVMESIRSISEIEIETNGRAKAWYDFFKKPGKFSLLVNHLPARSNTVIALSGDKESVNHIKAKAREYGFVLGNGYGRWAETSFRIANFPAIQPEEIDALKSFFETNGR